MKLSDLDTPEDGAVGEWEDRYHGTFDASESGGVDLEKLPGPVGG